jgi:hypothetical protein
MLESLDNNKLSSRANTDILAREESDIQVRENGTRIIDLLSSISSILVMNYFLSYNTL